MTIATAPNLTSEVVVSVARDFDSVPGGRFPWEGPNSGQKFREDILKHRYEEARSKDLKLVVELDGTAGYASSFLEEAFGGLVRKGDADKQDLLNRLVVISNDQPKWEGRVKRYIDQAQPE